MKKNYGVIEIGGGLIFGSFWREVSVREIRRFDFSFLRIASAGPTGDALTLAEETARVLSDLS